VEDKRAPAVESEECDLEHGDATGRFQHRSNALLVKQEGQKRAHGFDQVMAPLISAVGMEIRPRAGTRPEAAAGPPA
jgi:hypothetical protein